MHFYWSGTLIVRDPESLGRAIRDHRKSQGLTQVRLAGLANVSVHFLIDLEAGKPRKEIGKTLQVLRTLGLEVHLLSRSEQTAERRHVGPPRA